jgi:Ca-activated chloride channel family protein
MNRAWIVRGVVAAVAALLGLVVGLLLVGFDVLPGTGSVLDGGDSTADADPSPRADVPRRCSDDERVDVQVAAVHEIAPALQEVAAHAREADPMLECADINVAPAAPSDVTRALARGWTERRDGRPPHVWIPTTSTQVELARSETADLLPDVLPSLARSPTVIAMPQPMADALDWPDGDLDWDGVAQLTSADDAWADLDHPEWGRFRLRLVDGVDAEPTISAVTALADAVGALPGPDTADQSEEERFQSQAQLLLLERRVEYLGSSTAEQLDELRAADAADELLETVSAVPLTEQMVWLYNGGAQDPPDTPLAAWYSDEGSADADYPYARLDGAWSTTDTASAAEAFLAFLQSDEGLRRLRAHGFRDRSREATPELIEADGIRPELAAPAQRPPLALVTGAVAQAWRGLSQTGNLLGVVDVSGSMKTPVPGTGASRLQLSARGLAAGVQLLDPESHCGLWEFSTRLDGDQDHRELISVGPLNEELNGGVTRQEAEVAAIRDLRPLEDTGLYDTILASYRHMLDNYEADKLNAVIFFTDGRNDDDEGVTLRQLQERLRDLVDPEREVLFIGVGYGPEADFDALRAVTRITGGKLYDLDRPDDIRNVFIDVQTGNVG